MFVFKLKSLQEEVLQKDKEIKRLKKAIEVSDGKLQELEQAQEVTLQKTIRHVKSEMEKENGIRIAELKAEHQAEIDRMLETSKRMCLRGGVSCIEFQVST